MADTISEAIEDSALGPKRVTGDSGSVEQHPIADQIAADRYLAGKTAAASNTPPWGMRVAKIIPPGAV